MRKRALGPVLLLVAWYCGCTADPAAPSAGAGQGADAGVDDDAAPGGGEGDAGGSAEEIDPNTSVEGNVGLLFGVSDAKEGRVGASFLVGSKADPSATKKKVGPCVVTTYGSAESPEDVYASAGTIRITGGKSAIELTPSADKSYAPHEVKGPVWSGGDMISVHGDGKDAPAFDLSFAAPSTITLASPTIPTAGLTHKRAEPFTATWTGESSGVVVLYFDAAAAENAYSMTCTFPRSAGTGTIPAAAFADFPAVEGTFDFYVQKTVESKVGDWTMRFAATTGIGADGTKTAAGPVRFE